MNLVVQPIAFPGVPGVDWALRGVAPLNAQSATGARQKADSPTTSTIEVPSKTNFWSRAGPDAAKLWMLSQLEFNAVATETVRRIAGPRINS